MDKNKTKFDIYVSAHAAALASLAVPTDSSKALTVKAEAFSISGLDEKDFKFWSSQYDAVRNNAANLMTVPADSVPQT